MAGEETTVDGVPTGDVAEAWRKHLADMEATVDRADEIAALRAELADRDNRLATVCEQRDTWRTMHHEVEAERDEARLSAHNARHAQRINELGLLAKLHDAQAERDQLAETVKRREEHLATVEADLANAEAFLGRRVATAAGGHPEDYCHRCGGPNVQWVAPSPLWNAVMRGGSIGGDDEFDGIVCPTCFATLAERRGIAGGWRLSAQMVRVALETISPSGRVWDDGSWLWRDALTQSTVDDAS